MTAPIQDNQIDEKKQNDKELNFRLLESKYQRQLEQERGARIEAERIAHEALNKKQSTQEDEEEDSEPYVDKKKLNKTLQKFGQQSKQETMSEINKAVAVAREQERQEAWIENNEDFFDVLQNHSDKLMQKSPHLAKSILKMPDNFDRQKLVYQTIKELGLDQPEQKKQSIQEKIDSNKRNPGYQPSMIGTAPYQTNADFSEAGQKQAYAKMKELQSKLRL